jgi:hypothetical protein
MENLRFGRIEAVISNIYRDRKKHPAPYTAADFYPSINRASATKPKKSTLYQLYDKMRGIAGMMGGYNRGV